MCRHRKGYLGLSAKATLLMFVSAFIPILCLAMLFYLNIAGNYEGRIRQLRSDEIQTKLSLVNDAVDEMTTLARRISTNRVLMDYFSNTYMDAADRVESVLKRIDPFIHWMEDTSTGETYLRFFTENPLTYESETIYRLGDYQGQDWYRYAAEATVPQPAFEPCHPSRHFKYELWDDIRTTYEASVFMPMLARYNDAPRTVVEVSIDLMALFDSLCDGMDADQVGLMMVDSGGEPIYAAGYRAAGMDEAPLTVGGEAESYIRTDGHTTTVYRHAIDKLGLTLVMLYNADEILQEERATLVRFGLIYLGILLLGTCMLVNFIRNVTGPIGEVARSMRDAHHEEVGAPVPARGKGEVADLCNGYNAMVGRISTMINTVYKEELLRKEAELDALYNQINPHFLYNSIESIRMMLEVKGDEECAELLQSFGNIIRYSLDSRQRVPLAREVEHVRKFCALQNVMLNGRLSLDVQVSDEALACSVPTLSVQPLVENSIKHGFYGVAGGCRLTLRGEVRPDGALEITVQDNGKGMTEAAVKAVNDRVRDGSASISTEGQTNIGLRNVHQRVVFRFGEGYGVMLESSLGRGTVARLTLPACRDLEEDV